MAVAEAMSCGCYPVVSNIPAFKKLTGNGNCGILFEPGNVEQLAASLEKAFTLDLEVERKKMRDYYQQYLSANAIAQQIEDAARSINKTELTAK
jgi:glycosyltransferase involved in cell wall biosynthesis